MYDYDNEDILGEYYSNIDLIWLILFTLLLFLIKSMFLLSRVKPEKASNGICFRLKIGSCCGRPKNSEAKDSLTTSPTDDSHKEFSITTVRVFMFPLDFGV